jgi:hypothetical protein
MAKRKSHHIVIQEQDGSVGIYPLKQWLRDNPNHIPNGMDPEIDITHTLRRGLRNNGWRMEEEHNRVLLIRPSKEGDTSYADELVDIEKELNDDFEDEYYEAEEITFGLERDLQLALRGRIDQLESGLVIIDGGRERITEAGRIDITAKDSKDNIVIVELKAGTANQKAIAQILAYMGVVSETDKQPVRGILVAGDFSKQVVFAAKAIPNLELKKYSFQFTFEGVE